MRQSSNRNKSISSLLAWWNGLHPTERPTPGADVSTQNYKQFVDDLTLHWKAASADIESTLSKQKQEYRKQFIDLAKKVRDWHTEAKKELIKRTRALLEKKAEEAAKWIDAPGTSKVGKEFLNSFVCDVKSNLLKTGAPQRKKFDAALRLWDKELDACISFSSRVPTLLLKTCPTCPTPAYNGMKHALWNDIQWDSILSHGVPIVSHERWKSSPDLHCEALDTAKLQLLDELREQVRDHPFFANVCTGVWAKYEVLAWLLLQKDNTPEAITVVTMASYQWLQYEAWLKRVTIGAHTPDRDRWLARHSETEFMSMLGARAQFGGNLHLNESALMFVRFLLENLFADRAHASSQGKDIYKVRLVCDAVAGRWCLYLNDDETYVVAWKDGQQMLQVVRVVLQAQSQKLSYPEIAQIGAVKNPKNIHSVVDKLKKKSWCGIFDFSEPARLGVAGNIKVVIEQNRPAVLVTSATTR